MNIRLTQNAEELIRRKVASGPYLSGSEVIEEALRLLDVRDQRIQALRESVADGFAAIERGEGIELTAALLDERIHRADERADRGETPNSDVSP